MLDENLPVPIMLEKDISVSAIFEDAHTVGEPHGLDLFSCVTPRFFDTGWVIYKNTVGLADGILVLNFVVQRSQGFRKNYFSTR